MVASTHDSKTHLTTHLLRPFPSLFYDTLSMTYHDLTQQHFAPDRWNDFMYWYPLLHQRMKKSLFSNLCPL